MANCDQCAQEITRRSQLRFTNLADILIVSVERTVRNSQLNRDEKITDPINVSRDLVIPTENRPDTTFTLISAIEHKGNDPRG